MLVHICQFYIQQGAEFPFSHLFQRYLSEEVTDLTVPSEKFIQKYGLDYELLFNISSKHELEETQILGPTVFRKDKDVEYSVFIPFSAVATSDVPPETALEYIFDGVCRVFEMLKIDTTYVRREQQRLIQHICSDPTMFRDNDDADAGIGPPVWGEYIKQ